MVPLRSSFNLTLGRIAHGFREPDGAVSLALTSPETTGRPWTCGRCASAHPLTSGAMLAQHLGSDGKSMHRAPLTLGMWPIKVQLAHRGLTD